MSSLSSVSNEALVEDTICSANYLFYSPNPMQFVFPASPNISQLPFYQKSYDPSFLSYSRLYNFDGSCHGGALSNSIGIGSNENRIGVNGVTDISRSNDSMLGGMDQRVTAGLLNQNSVKVPINSKLVSGRPSRNMINKIRSKLDFETKNSDARSQS